MAGTSTFGAVKSGMAKRTCNESDPIRFRDRLAGYGVHVFTASGAVIGVWMVASIMRSDYRMAFFLMVVAVVIDAVDGTLARRFHVRRVCPHIDGRTLDDIVDYLNYTFIPLLLLCHAGWLPEPVWGWIAIPLVCSLFGFAHTGAKEEDAGFFRGFPSYWNVVVLYVAVWMHQAGPWWVLVSVLTLSLLTVAPVRFVYPNRPPCWPLLFLGGSAFWLVSLLAIIWQYPDVSQPLIILSLVYPLLYVMLSIYLDIQQRISRDRS